tara:strand:+ start:1198 stop:1797 length:600 start_codon:yes stop_codon:yes gene_type:complete
MIHTLKVTITVYVFSMFCYSAWYFLQVLDVANMNPNGEWVGSLCYLPHGSRVLMFCFFRYYSLPGLYLAEITGPSLINHEDYMNGWSIAAFASLFSVVAAVELVKWTRATPGFFSFFKEVNFENYKFLYLVIIVSALLNGLLVNLILSLINSTTAISVVTVFRFAVGDFLGAIAVIATLWIIFRTLVDTRLIIDPRVED